MRRRIQRAAEIGAVLLVLGLFAFLASKVLEPDGPGAFEGSPPRGEDPHAYAFFETDPDTGDPIRFNPCETLHYVINPDAAPENAEQMVHAAVQVVSEASGIEFRYDGLTDERLTFSVRRGDLVVNRDRYQPQRYGDRWAPIIFVWDEIQEGLGVDRSGEWVGGFAQAVAVRVGDGIPRYVTGEVVIEPRGPGVIETPVVVLHELLHVMGLAHVMDRQQIMHHSGADAARLGAGDRTGLKRLGKEAGCIPPLTPREAGET